MKLILTLPALLAFFCGQSFAVEKPNILLILADNLGYGDVRCYNDQSKVATPHLDRLAREGMRFTDAHSPATGCTPSRYSLMTGQMVFRVPNGGRVFDGIGGPSIIAPGRLTLPAMLRSLGYATACVGKWHVGLTFFDQDGQPVRGDGKPNTVERAYAMTDPMEYFAETTEAFFSRNDFFPFTRDELKKLDPEMFALLGKLWGVTETK